MAKKFKIKKGDKVTVVTGRDKGKQGEVLRVLREDDDRKELLRPARSSRLQPGRRLVAVVRDFVPCQKHMLFPGLKEPGSWQGLHHGDKNVRKPKEPPRGKQG